MRRGRAALLRIATAAAAACLAAASAAAAPGARLGELTWPEAQARLAAGSLVIVPFGAGAK